MSPQKGQLNAASYYMTQTPRVTAWAAPGRGTREHGTPRAETLTLWEHAAFWRAEVERLEVELAQEGLKHG